MNATLEAEIPVDLLARVLALPDGAKRRLADLLTQSVDAPDDLELYRKEIQALIADRVEGFLSRRYKTVDAKESAERVRAKLLEEYP
ncbi:MAG: hypothetical protein JNK93_18630 [Planctomycetia bacterium]|nr:hypothetical protein [Planctomycetia bacterium]